MVLDEGRIAEMKTGEGKTLTATAAVALNALTGKGVHVVTVNDYLAGRDAQWMSPVYEALGLSVGVIGAMMPESVILPAVLPSWMALMAATLMRYSWRGLSWRVIR